jgi:ribosomal protein S18 acetylase RimI-like enzyme
MNIVKATKNEIPDIVSLNMHVQRIHHDSHPDVFKPVSDDQPIHGFFDYLIQQENNTFLVAYLDSIPVGYAWYAVEEKPDFPMKYSRKQIYIHQIAVHEDYRRQKVGKSLFYKIEKQAQEQAITHFELDSWSFNTEAHKFFNNLGFETYNINMWRRSPNNAT